LGAERRKYGEIIDVLIQLKSTKELATMVILFHRKTGHAIIPRFKDSEKIEERDNGRWKSMTTRLRIY
jgi:hypothetical protein